MKQCISCPRHCKVDRSKARGFCGANDTIEIASFCLHRGEEPVISGDTGSGTIFFSHCNLKCVYCQNHDISQEGMGRPTAPEDVARTMISLQEQGAHNINLVSPSQYAYLLPDIIRSAKQHGLILPIVYNTNGYDDVATLQRLEGLVDIYMPDIKYSDNTMAARYSACGDYVEHSRNALREMFRQAGPLQLDGRGIARRGLLVRHLVLPNDIAGSFASLDFLASLSTGIYISVMAQFHPCYKAAGFNELRRVITPAEYERVIEHAVALDFETIFTQEIASHETYLPDFNEEHPFEH